MAIFSVTIGVSIIFLKTRKKNFYNFPKTKSSSRYPYQNTLCFKFNKILLDGSHINPKQLSTVEKIMKTTIN